MLLHSPLSSSFISSWYNMMWYDIYPLIYDITLLYVFTILFIVILFPKTTIYPKLAIYFTEKFIMFTMKLQRKRQKPGRKLQTSKDWKFGVTKMGVVYECFPKIYSYRYWSSNYVIYCIGQLFKWKILFLNLLVKLYQPVLGTSVTLKHGED